MPGYGVNSHLLYISYQLILEKTERILIKNRLILGCGEFKASGTRFEINGQPVFLRGTTECCIFPLTGYPPSDVNSWEKALQTCKNHRLNHVRSILLSAEAAFAAADRLGIYFHIECSSWANRALLSVLEGLLTDLSTRRSDRILKEYGNHPHSACLPMETNQQGENQTEYLENCLKYWKSKRQQKSLYVQPQDGP